MGLSGDEWKYSCDGGPLMALQAKRFAVTKQRLLIAIEGWDNLQETRIIETSPDGEYVKLGTANGWTQGSVWMQIDKIHLVCVLPDHKQNVPISG